MLPDPNCRLCPLGGTATTTCVPGRTSRVAPSANAGPQAFVVGEAPGRQEDEKGMPFVGPSGNKLADALRDAGIEDVYLTNAVKCFPIPAGHKNPLPVHVKACKPYLEAEIDRVKPTAILALGAKAWQALGGTGSIVEEAGKEIWSNRFQCWVMPALHPAFVLRQPGREDSWKLVIRRYATLLNGTRLVIPPVKVHTMSDQYQVTRLVRMLGETTLPIAYDFETSMLPWWHRDLQVHSVAFSVNGQEAFYVPISRSPDPNLTDATWETFIRVSFNWGPFRQTMMNRDVVKIAHNAPFDDLVWHRFAGWHPYVNCDTMALAHLLDENGPKGLKWNLRARLGWPDYAIDVSKIDMMDPQEVAFYNGCDAAGTWLLREKLMAELARDQRLHAYFAAQEMPAIRALERLMLAGVPVDRIALEDTAARERLRQALAGGRLPLHNPGSPKQVAAWLYDDLKLPVLKRTESGQPSTDEETIHRLARQAPQIRPLLTWRAADKNLSTYLEPPRAETEQSFDGRRHFEYRHTKVETGRWSGNFHVIPRDARIRGVYAAEPGRVLISADLKQVEARLVAWAAAGKPADWQFVNPASASMLLAFKEDRDLYVEFAAEALGKHPSQVSRGENGERQLMGKVPVLAQLYDISPQGLQAYAWREFQADWTFAQAEHLWKTFRRLFPEIPRWHQREKMLIGARGWTRSDVGRIRRLPDALSGDKDARHEALASGINFPIQNLAWEITKALLVYMDSWLLTMMPTLDGVIVGTVHDSLILDVPDRADAINWVRYAIPAALIAVLRPDGVLRKLGLKLPEGLIQAELAVGRWGSKLTPEQYLEQKLKA